MVGDACQRSTHALSDRPGGKDNVQLAGSDLGILIEGFVKIPQAEKQDGVGIILLDIQILLSNRSDIIIGHGLILWASSEMSKCLSINGKNGPLVE